ncbi:MAG: TonB-dependent receptor [Steroidobacter sp.]
MIDIKKAVRAAIESDKARITLYSSASIAALYALTSATPVLAADAGAKGGDELEEIVVSGYRKSLQSARDIKRDADVIVDSINATDIGALPDRSVTEAMSRIPGVSINRFAAGNDPDHFSVEGSGVTIRGLSYTHSEFNGRDTFSANNGRALSFADVPSELLGGVDVFKSPTADRIEGGIGGVVNLRTRLPFDSKGQLISGSLDANYTDFEKKTTPAGSILYSNRWDTGIGEIGLLASGSYSDLKTRSDKIQVSNFYEYALDKNGQIMSGVSQGPTLPPPPNSKEIYQLTHANQIAYIPRGAVEGTEEFDHSRQGYSLALQWSSPDKSWDATAQFLRSDSRETWTEKTIEIATDNVSNPGNAGWPNTSSDIQAVYGTRFAVGPSGLMSSGTITAPTGWSSDWNNKDANGNPSGRVPANGLQTNNYTRDVDQHYVTDDFSAHVNWTPNNNVKLEFDVQHVKSKVNDLDVEMNFSTYEDMYIQLTGSNGLGLPLFIAQPPTTCPGTPSPSAAACAASGNLGTAQHPLFFNAPHNTYADRYNYFPRSAMDHIEGSDGIENAFRLDGTFSLDDNSWIKSFKAGVRYSDRNQTARYTTYNWGVLSEAWGGTGPIFLDEAPSSNLPAVDYKFPDYFRGQLPSPVGPQGRLFYDGNTTKDYVKLINYANAISYAWQAPQVVNGVTYSSGWNPLWRRPGIIPGTDYLPQEINPTIEKTQAAYIMMNLAHNLSNGWKLTGNVGVRVTGTDRDAIGSTAVGTANFPTAQDCATAIANSQTHGTAVQQYCLLNSTQQAQLQQYFQQNNLPSTIDFKYGYVLPSLNLKLDVGDGLQWRFDYFKGIFNPDFGFTRNDFTVGWDSQGQNFTNSFGGTATAGNPYLRPTKSDNVDLSLEWYFGSNGVNQLSVAAFYKELKDVVVNGSFITNVVRNGLSLPVYLTSATNSPDLGLIKGFEVGYQQQYDFLPGWLSGFGVNANYTYTSSNGVRQGTLSNTATNVQNTSEQNRPFLSVDIGLLPLQGLSKNTINITPFYSKGPWDIRLAYSWRSQFLLTTQDVIVPYQPIMNLSTGQLDGSIFYSINDNFKIGLQAANITDEVTKTAAVINDYLQLAPRSYFINDRRFALGVRFTFQ